MKHKAMVAVAAAAVFVSGVANADNYIVIGGAKSKNIDAAIEAAGGTVLASYPFGVAVASSSEAGFSVPGLTVVPDVGFETEANTADRMIVTRFCPFGETASNHPDIVCKLDQGIVAGLLEGANADGVPVVTPHTAHDDDCFTTI